MNRAPDQIAREWLINRLEKQFSRYASNWIGGENSIFIEQMTLLRAFVHDCWPKETTAPERTI